MESTALKDKFSSSNNSMATAKRSAAALGLATLLSFSSATMAADSNQCAPLKVVNNVTLSASSSSISSSEVAPYPLSISAQHGKTIGAGNVPMGLVNLFETKDVKSECFIDKYYSQSGEPEFSFYILGQRHKFKGKSRWTFNELKGNQELIDSVVAAVKPHQTMGELVRVSHQQSNDKAPLSQP